MLRLRILILFSFFNLLSFGQKAREYALSGVVHGSDDSPLSGASVYLHETLSGALTNDSGRFQITGIKPGIYHLHVSYVGYHGFSKSIQINDSTPFQDILLEKSNLELHEAVVEQNALKLDPSQLPLSITVLGEDQLKNNPSQTLAGALAQVPGVNSIQTGIGVGKPVIRGLTGNRIAVLENGVKQQGQQWGGDHGLEIDPLNAERVEVIKGPASLLYGSDGIGGIIHLKQPLIPISGQHEVKLNLLGRSVNQSFGSSLSAKGNQNGWVYRFRFTTQDYGDYSLPADSFGLGNSRYPVYQQKLKNTAGKERHLALQLGLHRSWGYTRISYSRFDQRIGIFPGADGETDSILLAPDASIRNIGLPNQSILHHKLISNTNIHLGKNWLEIDAGYQYNIRTENAVPEDSTASLEAGNAAHVLRLQTWSLQSRYHQKIKKGTRSFGLSMSHQNNSIGGYEFLMPAFQSFQAGIFAFQNKQMSNRSNLSMGLRYDWAYLHIQSFEEHSVVNGVPEVSVLAAENKRNFSNFSGAIGWTHKVNAFALFKLNLGKSFRIPNTQELSVNGVHEGTFRYEQGNGNLNPEQAWQLDLGYEMEKTNWFVSLTPFMNYFSNFIYLQPSHDPSPIPKAGYIYRYQQGRTFMSGGELSAEYHPLKQLHLEMGMEYVYAQNLSADRPLPMIPPFQLKTAVEWNYTPKSSFWGTSFLRVDWQRASAQNRTELYELKTPAYQLIHLGMGSKLRFKKNYEMEISLQCQNLLNTFYLNNLALWRNLNIPQPGRNIQLRMGLPLWQKKGAQI
ncbi:MAG: TonB-dependent receptor [Bacteroidetes bacterium]|nr:TonB-dependent receptor [Bacteroidota bacterium]